MTPPSKCWQGTTMEELKRLLFFFKFKIFTKQHLVRIRKRSAFGIKYLFCSLKHDWTTNAEPWILQWILFMGSLVLFSLVCDYKNRVFFKKTLKPFQASLRLPKPYIFQGKSGHLQLRLWIHNPVFWRRPWRFPAVFLAAKIGILSQSVMFSAI